MKFESVSGQVYKGSITQDKMQSELHKLSVHSKLSRQQEKCFHHYLTLSKESKFTLEIQ